MKANLPPNETERLAVLYSLGLLDSPPEDAFDDIVKLASHICGTPIAAISLVDSGRQWFKAAVGLQTSETDRDSAFCAHAILEPGRPFVVPDAEKDSRFSDSALVTGEPRIRFYAGIPLVTREGCAIGSLCAIDTHARVLNDGQLGALTILGRQVIRLIESRQLVVDLAEQKAALDHHAIVAISDLTGHLTYVNDHFCAITGFGRAELMGTWLLGARDPHPCQSFFSQAWETARNGRVWSGEVEFRPSAGSPSWIQTTVVPMRDSEGKPWQFIAIGTDITERKLAEEVLQRRKAELRILFDLIPALLWFKDTKNRVLRLNARAATAACRSVADLEGHTCEEIYPESAEKFYAEDLAVIATREPRTGIVEKLHAKGGPPMWVQTDKVPYFEKDGSVGGIVVMSQDITQRMEADQKLRLLGSAIEQSKESIVISEASSSEAASRVVFVNAACVEMTGYSEAQAVGRIAQVEGTGCVPSPAVVLTHHTPSQNESLHGETVEHRRDGSPYHMEWQVVPIRNPEGIVTHYVEVQRDISKRKTAEIELAHAREAALESVRLKSRFLANMSHELRTPLNTINGLSATLMDQDLPGPAKEAAALILQCGETLLENIQTILTHSSLEAGKTKLQPKPLSLSRVVMNALRMTGEAARRKGLDLAYFMEADIPDEVIGDSFRLQQVIVNLLANGIKFTTKGRVQITIRRRSGDTGSVALCFSVSDTGVGIAKENLGNLFKPFSQANDLTTRHFEGTGLGLAIAKSIVELMGGKISVRSWVGVGSTFKFTVTLPVVKDSPTVFAGGYQPELSGKKVLVIEPNPARRRQLLAIARSWNIEAEAQGATKGSHATDRPFDFIIRRRPWPATPSMAEDAMNSIPESVPVLWLVKPGHPAPSSTHGRHAMLHVPCDPVDLGKALVSLLKCPANSEVLAAPAAKPAKLGTRIPLRILCADDTSSNREGFKLMCRHLGYEVDVVEDGVGVLVRLESATYDLLLLDVQMPVLDGLSTAREIRRRFADRPGRPVTVAVTASAQPEDKDRCMESGMDDYLTKPLLPRDIQACIERHFGAKIPASLSPAPAAPSHQGPDEWVSSDHLTALTEGIEDDEASELVQRLYSAAASDYAGMRQQLAEACREHHAKNLASLVHGLKGCVLSLGWMRMAKSCIAALEEVRAGKFARWDTLPEELESQYKASSAEMERHPLLRQKSAAGA